jgi:RND family efflux transporter MFP subunit
MNKTTVFFAGFFLLAMTGCRDKIEPGTATVARQAVSGVSTMQVELSETTLFHEATATVTPEVESMVASRIMGPVAAIPVKEGDRVKSGQLLVVIDSEDISNKLSGAEAAYREAVQALSSAEQNMLLAENTYSRFKNLYDEKALSLQELDKIETQKKVAVIEYERLREMVKRTEAGLEEAKVFQDYKQIKSPVDGIVTGKFIDPGTMAMPGMRLLTIEDTSRYRLEAEIDESFAGQIEPGADVEVEISSLNLKLQGKISKTVPAVDPRSRTFKVFITLPDATNLHSGLYARVRIPVGQQEVLLVPAEAVVTKGQLTGVYVVGSNQVITYRLVRSGKAYDGNLAILSGLKVGETIIAENGSKIVDGSILQTDKTGK